MSRKRYSWKPSENYQEESWLDQERRIAVAVAKDTPPPLQHKLTRRERRNRKPQPKTPAPPIDLGLVVGGYKLIRRCDEEIDGEGHTRLRWYDVGVRFDIREGEWWFYKWPSPFKPGTWTHHRQGKIARNRSLSPILIGGHTPLLDPTQTTHFGTTQEMARAMSHCPQLLIHLFREKARAEDERASRFA